MDISLIVPVYNVEQYLDRCIQSLLNQRMNSYEIILIDDGSTDKSGKICDQYSEKFKHIKVIHKKNEGLGLTRNRGIKDARGKYIMFIDSDDFIEKNCLPELYHKMEDNHFDVCWFHRCIFNNGQVICHQEQFPEKIPSAKRLAEMCLGEPLKTDAYEIGPAWKAIYRRQFLIEKELLFESERKVLSEDYIFSAKLCLEKPRCGFFHRTIYYYCDNNTSLTNSYRAERPYRALYLYQRMKEIAVEADMGKMAMFRIYNNFIINMLVSFKHISMNTCFYRAEKIKKIKTICLHAGIKTVLNEYRQTDTWQLALFRWLAIHNRCSTIYWLIKIRYR